MDSGHRSVGRRHGALSHHRHPPAPERPDDGSRTTVRRGLRRRGAAATRRGVTGDRRGPGTMRVPGSDVRPHPDPGARMNRLVRARRACAPASGRPGIPRSRGATRPTRSRPRTRPRSGSTRATAGPRTCGARPSVASGAVSGCRGARRRRQRRRPSRCAPCGPLRPRRPHASPRRSPGAPAPWPPPACRRR